MKKEELSERALSLCTHALRLNPFNYNVWAYRRKVLRTVKYDARKEICWSEAAIRENPKNFYAWEHRRAIAIVNSNFCDAQTELSLTEAILENDAKSYHAWHHRQWSIRTYKYSNFGLLTNEMNFTAEKLSEDLRNNSAWNQRFFILNLRGKTDFAVVKKEFCFVVEHIKKAIDNESAWNYLRGVLESYKNVQKLAEFQLFENFVENEFYEHKNNNRHLIAFLIDSKIEMILLQCESNEIIHTQKVRELCNLMAEKVDKIRRNYWKFVYKKFYYDKIRCNRKDEDYCCKGGAKRNQTWRENIGKKINEEQKDDESFMNLEREMKVKKTKNKTEFKKGETCEKAKGIGTDLLFDLMNKYNR